MFPAIDRSRRRAALDDNKRAVDEALTLGRPASFSSSAACRRTSAGRPASKDLASAREMVRDGIGELLEYARPAGMPLAIEPLHPMYAADRACVNTMPHANDLCDELGDGRRHRRRRLPRLVGPEALTSEIERAGGHAGRLLAFHICDWLVPTTDLLLDRGMMGDGVIDIPLIRSWMEAAGYRGAHEVEIFSANNWWKKDPDEVLITCIERHRTRLLKPLAGASSGDAGIRGKMNRSNSSLTSGVRHATRLHAPAARPRCRARLRPARFQRQQSGAGPGDHVGRGRNRQPGDHAGVRRRPQICGRDLPAPPDRSRRRELSEHPDRHAPGSRPVAGRVRIGDAARLFQRDDGRFAARRTASRSPTTTTTST